MLTVINEAMSMVLEEHMSLATHSDWVYPSVAFQHGISIPCVKGGTMDKK